MGRRKIEIKAIKDDRNRSVTFLKRKGGLFKKAHELSVLCSVDVAVVIFGNNKKLYEYSSSDIGEIMTRYQYYGVANEHKGPADFDGKGKLDDDDDEEEGSVPSHHGSVEPQMMPPHFQNQANFQHIRHHTPSASPPIANIVFPHHPQQRQHTPQPQSGSRPSSRNAMPRTTATNLVQQQQQQQHHHHQHHHHHQQQQQQHHGHPMPPNGYAYMPNHPAIYTPPNGAGLPPHPTALPQHMQPAPPRSVGVSPPQYPNYGQPPPHPQPHPYPPQVRHMYAEEHRRSMTPTFPQERLHSRSPPQPRPQPQHPQPPPQPQQPPAPPHPESEGQPPAPQQMLEPVKRMSTKSRSIFTPIDESRSILSQHWASSTTNVEPNRAEAPPHYNGLAHSAGDLAALGGIKTSTSPPPPPLVRDPSHQQTLAMASGSLSEDFPTPSRSNSGQLGGGGGGKRPVLKVHIPDEPSEGDSSSSPRSGNAAGPPAPDHGHANADANPGVVLPPPSPSASALLSAGASGPPNPFARPHPPQSNASTGGANTTTTTTTTTHHNSSNNDNSNNSNHNINNNSINIDTPASALPSRFMTNEFLPSPSSFYSDWPNYGGGSTTLPSPLNFATPVVGTGPSFLRDDGGSVVTGALNGKRKSPEADGGDGDAKRARMDVV